MDSRVMRNIVVRATSLFPIWRVWLVSLATLLGALSCGKNNDPPPAQPVYVQQPPGYSDGTTPALAATPVVAGPAPASTLSQPGPLALPCKADVQCLTHHCNLAAGKCAWPCQTDNDCMPGNACIAPTCLPKLQ